MAGTLSLFAGYEEDLKRARAANLQRRYDDGLAVLERYKGLLRTDVDFMLLYADLLIGKAAFADADAILSRVLAIDPLHVQANSLRISSLSGLGRRAEALALLDRARAADPDNQGILGHYLALLLVEQGPAVAIAALKAEYLRRTPPYRLDWPVEKLRQKAMSLHDAAELARLDPDNLLGLAGKAESQGYNLRQIYEAFEGIGCDCEVGIVQRKSGVEPLSLLRWTSITAEKLIELLACDLDGYERPEHYSLSGNFYHEFFLCENKFGTKAHTGVNQIDISPDEFLDRMTRRQGFLKRKFVADAAEGRKIFVHKANVPLGEAEMTGIETELVRLGVRHCLFVMPAGDRARAGTVEFVSPRRAVGYLSALMPDTRFDEWNSIAVAVYDRFLGRDAKA